MTLFPPPSLPGTGQRSFNYSYAKSGGHVSHHENFLTRYDEVPSFFFLLLFFSIIFLHPHNLDTRDIRNFYQILREKISRRGERERKSIFERSSLYYLSKESL